VLTPAASWRTDTPVLHLIRSGLGILCRLTLTNAMWLPAPVHYFDIATCSARIYTPVMTWLLVLMTLCPLACTLYVINNMPNTMCPHLVSHYCILHYIVFLLPVITYLRNGCLPVFTHLHKTICLMTCLYVIAFFSDGSILVHWWYNTSYGLFIWLRMLYLKLRHYNGMHHIRNVTQSLSFASVLTLPCVTLHIIIYDEPFTVWYHQQLSNKLIFVWCVT